MDPDRIRAYLQLACAALGMDIGEIWWTSGETIHQDNNHQQQQQQQQQQQEQIGAELVVASKSNNPNHPLHDPHHQHHHHHHHHHHHRNILKFVQLYTSKTYENRRNDLINPTDDGEDIFRPDNYEDDDDSASSSSSSEEDDNNNNNDSNVNQHVLSPRMVNEIHRSSQVVWANSSSPEGLIGRSDIQLQTAVGVPVAVDNHGNMCVVLMFSPDIIQSTSTAIDYLYSITQSATSCSIPCLLPVFDTNFIGHNENNTDDENSHNRNQIQIYAVQRQQNNVGNTNKKRSLLTNYPTTDTERDATTATSLGKDVTARYVSLEQPYEPTTALTLRTSKEQQYFHRQEQAPDLSVAPKDTFGIPMLPTHAELDDYPVVSQQPEQQQRQQQSGPRKLSIQQQQQMNDDERASLPPHHQTMIDIFDEASYGVWNTIMDPEEIFRDEIRMAAAQEQEKQQQQLQQQQQQQQEHQPQVGTPLLTSFVDDTFDLQRDLRDGKECPLIGGSSTVVTLLESSTTSASSSSCTINSNSTTFTTSGENYVLSDERKARLQEFCQAFLGMSVFDVADVFIPARGRSVVHCNTTTISMPMNIVQEEEDNRVNPNSSTTSGDDCVFHAFSVLANNEQNTFLNEFISSSHDVAVPFWTGAVGRAYSSSNPVWSANPTVFVDPARARAFQRAKIKTVLAVPVFTRRERCPSCVVTFYSLVRSGSVPFVLKFVQQALRLLWDGLNKVQPHTSIADTAIWETIVPADLGEMAADLEMQQTFLSKKRRHDEQRDVSTRIIPHTDHRNENTSDKSTDEATMEYVHNEYDGSNNKDNAIHGSDRNNDRVLASALQQISLPESQNSYSFIQQPQEQQADKSGSVEQMILDSSQLQQQQQQHQQQHQQQQQGHQFFSGSNRHEHDNTLRNTGMNVRVPVSHLQEISLPGGETISVPLQLDENALASLNYDNNNYNGSTMGTAFSSTNMTGSESIFQATTNPSMRTMANAYAFIEEMNCQGNGSDRLEQRNTTGTLGESMLTSSPVTSPVTLVHLATVTNVEGTKCAHVMVGNPSSFGNFLPSISSASSLTHQHQQRSGPEIQQHQVHPQLLSWNTDSSPIPPPKPLSMPGRLPNHLVGNSSVSPGQWKPSVQKQQQQQPVSNHSFPTFLPPAAGASSPASSFVFVNSTSPSPTPTFLQASPSTVPVMMGPSFLQQQTPQHQEYQSFPTEPNFPQFQQRSTDFAFTPHTDAGNGIQEPSNFAFDQLEQQQQQQRAQLLQFHELQQKVQQQQHEMELQKQKQQQLLYGYQVQEEKMQQQQAVQQANISMQSQHVAEENRGHFLPNLQQQLPNAVMQVVQVSIPSEQQTLCFSTNEQLVPSQITCSQQLPPQQKLQQGDLLAFTLLPQPTMDLRQLSMNKSIGVQDQANEQLFHNPIANSQVYYNESNSASSNAGNVSVTSRVSNSSKTMASEGQYFAPSNDESSDDDEGKSQNAASGSVTNSSCHSEGKVCRIEGCYDFAVNRRPYCLKHSGNRLCEHEGCPKCAQGSTRFCIAHGGGRRCTVPGCDKGSRDKFFCAAHGGGKRCRDKECSKSAVGGSSYCTAHGGGRRCCIDGCDKSAQSSTSYCVKHGGGKKCSQDDCEKVARGRTLYCAAHGGGIRCKLPGCNRVAIGKMQLCRTHGGGSAANANGSRNNKHDLQEMEMDSQELLCFSIPNPEFTVTSTTTNVTNNHFSNY